MDGFRSAGWSVFPYIVGDRVLVSWVTAPKLHERSSGRKRLGADIMRIGSNFWHGRSAYRRIGKKVDWVYERFGVFQSLGSIFQRHGIPWILETNTPFALENNFEPGRKTVHFQNAAKNHEVQVYRRCDALIVQTSALKEIVLEFADIRPDKIFVVPNAVDLKRFVDPPPIRKFAGPTLGFVGALRRWQALEHALHAIHDLSREGLCYSLVIVGEGAKRKEWQELARDLGLSARVFFAGSIPMEQIPSWIAGFDMGFCGQSERVAARPMYFSPLKLYEYMAAAKPVVASSHEDAQRLVVQGKTGYTFAPDSLPALVNALRRAWHERDSWREMGLRARQVIASGHTWEARINGMIADLKHFLQSRGSRAVG